jgi:RNA polymerase sigma factor (sigma-70 family)
MINKPLIEFLQRFGRTAFLQEGQEQSDGQLLERFVRGQDDVALEALVRRHAPMVWGVCRRMLARPADAEDAFQATFLVLLRKAASIRSRDLLANWLYGVAYQTARKARQRNAQRYAREKQVETLPEPPTEPHNDAFGPELWAVVDSELSRLPEKYRIAIVLCALEGKSHRDVARQLRIAEGTVGSRLARGRALLARRLTRHGLGVSVASVTGMWSQQASGALPAALLTRTIKAVGLMAAGQTVTAGLLSTKVPPLTDGVLRAILAAERNRRLLFAAFLVACLTVVPAAAIFGYRFLAGGSGTGGTTPEPVIVEVAAPFRGAAAEEVERQVAIPLEVGLAGLPRLQSLRSQSSFGMAVVRVRFDDRTDYVAAREEVIKRLQLLPPLPPGVTPVISAALPEHEVFRYTLAGPVDAAGRPVYTLNDLRVVQDWVVEREFRRVPRVADAEGRGGAVKRYEVHPDPERLRRFGISLNQLQGAVANANHNVGGDYLIQGDIALNVRGVGLFGGGEDPMSLVRGINDPGPAAARLRDEERKRIREIRSIVITTVNNRAVLVEDVVEGGRLVENEQPGERGVVVGARRQGDVALRRRGDEGADGLDQERVEGVVFLRRGEDAGTALRGIRAKVEELNAGGVLLPGLRLEPLLERGGRAEDGFWMRAEFPRNVAPGRLAEGLRTVRRVVGSQAEVAAVLTETDEPDAGAPRPGSGVVLVRLKPGGAGSRVTEQLQRNVAEELSRKLPDVRLTFSTSPPDNFAEAFEAAPGEVVLRLFGPDLDELQEAVARADKSLRGMEGVEDVRPVGGLGVTHLEFRVDPEKCKKRGVSADDVNTLLQAVLNSEASTMTGGEKQFDITVRWPKWRRSSEETILDIPVDIINNQVVLPSGPGVSPSPSPSGSGLLPPSTKGSLVDTTNPFTNTPRRTLRDFVTPVGKDGAPNPQGQFERNGFTAIYRENGRRCVAVHFRLRTTSLDKVRDAITPQIPPSCHAEWVGR